MTTWPASSGFGQRRLQRGISLAITLTLLVLITLLAITSTWYGVAQERMAANQRQSALALMGAETAVRAGERWLYTHYERSNGAALVGNIAGSGGVYAVSQSGPNPATASFFAPRSWSATLGTEVADALVPYSSGDHSARLALAPRFLIEDLGPLRPGGADRIRELGVTGGEGYVSGGMSSAGNFDLRVFRVTGKSTGLNVSTVRTVQSTFAGRAKD